MENVLLNSDTSGTIVWVRVLGHIRGSDKCGGSNVSRINPEYNRGEGADNHKHDMGYTG